MALTQKQLGTFAEVERLPIPKIICIGKAAFRLYTCVRAAKGDTDKILACVDTFITSIEDCIKSR